MAKQQFAALSGVRFFLFVPIFFLHAHGGEPWQSMVMCSLTLFFVLSGVLTAFGRGQDVAEMPLRQIPAYTLGYLRRKILRFYPLHLLCFLYCAAMMLLCSRFGSFRPCGAADAVWKALLNLTLLQAWFPQEPVKFSYNGVTWFLSSMMCCYAAAPLLLRALSSLRRRAGAVGIIGVMLGCIAILMLPYALEADGSLSHDWCKLFQHEWHGHPLLRLPEFVVGMCGGQLLLIHEQYSHNTARGGCYPFIINALHISSLLLTCCVRIIPPPLLLIAGVFFLALLSTSAVSWCRFLSWQPIVTLGSWVMPVYLTHNLFLKTSRLMPFIQTDSYLQDTILFILSFVAAWCVMKVLSLLNYA